MRDRREMQAERALREILRLMASGLWVPGQRYTESELSTVLEVSRPAVREALAVLAEEKMVDVKARGVWMRESSKDVLTEVMLVRHALESLVVYELCRTWDIKMQRRIYRYLAPIDESIEEDDGLAFIEADTDFHCAMASNAGLEVIAGVLRGLRMKMLAAGIATKATAANMAESQREHKNILDAISRRDASGAEKAMRAHLDHSALRVGAAIPVWPLVGRVLVQA